MINFAICEDNPILRKNNVDEITSFMMNYNIEYDTYEFSTYDKDFENFVRKDYGFKVYLLDIVTEGKSGIDAARMIREKYDDWVSVIIMVTSHQEYKYEALASRLSILDFVNKVTKYQRKIREDLIIMLKSYDKKYKMLSYEYAHSFYKIEFRQIIWIEKEPDSKRCIIRTKMGQQFIPGT